MKKTIDDKLDDLSKRSKTSKLYVEKVLPLLSNRDKYFLELRYEKELSNKEIAKLESMTDSGVSNRFSNIYMKIGKTAKNLIDKELSDNRDNYRVPISKVRKKYGHIDHYCDTNDYMNIDVDKTIGIDYVVEYFFDRYEKIIFVDLYINHKSIEEISNTIGLPKSKIYSYINTGIVNKLYRYRACYCKGYQYYKNEIKKYIINEQDMPIEYLFIKTKIYNNLVKYKIKTVRDLKNADNPEERPFKGLKLKDFDWVGPVSYKHIMDSLKNWRKNIFFNIN